VSTFLDRLKAQDIARTDDVQILLDAELAEQRDALLAKLEEDDGDERLARSSKTKKIRVELKMLELQAADALVTLRFRRLPGRVWGELADRFPPRAQVPIDRQFGYNLDGLCMAAAMYRREPDEPGGEPGPAYGFRLEDGTEVPLSTEEWHELFDRVSGSDYRAIRDTVWLLNDFGPRQQREAAVKVSGATARSDKK
jgi:hypothetical protein